MLTSKEFTVDAGEYASSSKAKELVEKTRDEKKSRGLKQDEYTQSQFFGRDKLEALLKNSGSDCVGLKISILLEGPELTEEGLLIQAVDKNGNVLEPAAGAQLRGSGGAGVYGGPKCPKICLPPPGGNN